MTVSSKEVNMKKKKYSIHLSKTTTRTVSVTAWCPEHAVELVRDSSEYETFSYGPGEIEVDEIEEK